MNIKITDTHKRVATVSLSEDEIHSALLKYCTDKIRQDSPEAFSKGDAAEAKVILSKESVPGTAGTRNVAKVTITKSLESAEGKDK